MRMFGWSNPCLKRAEKLDAVGQRIWRGESDDTNHVSDRGGGDGDSRRVGWSWWLSGKAHLGRGFGSSAQRSLHLLLRVCGVHAHSVMSLRLYQHPYGGILADPALNCGGSSYTANTVVSPRARYASCMRFVG